MSKIFFGDKDPVGEYLSTTDGQQVFITGVIKNFENFTDNEWGKSLVKAGPHI